jgi:uncharacterized membrane protein
MMRFAFLGCLLLMVGCSSNDPSPAPEDEVQLPAVDCSKETVPTFAQVTIFSKTCVNCHATTKTGDARKGKGAEAAPDNINFDTYEAAKASALKAAAELYEDARGAMPPEDSELEVATDAEKHQVLVWAKCGTPQ